MKINVLFFLSISLLSAGLHSARINFTNLTPYDSSRFGLALFTLSKCSYGNFMSPCTKDLTHSHPVPATLETDATHFWVSVIGCAEPCKKCDIMDKSGKNAETALCVVPFTQGGQTESLDALPKVVDGTTYTLSLSSDGKHIIVTPLTFVSMQK